LPPKNPAIHPIEVILSSAVSRVLVALVAIPVFVVLTLLGGWYFFALVLLLVLLGVDEVLILAGQKQVWLQRAVAWSFATVLVVAMAFGKADWFMTGVLLLALASLTVELFRNKGSALLNVSATVLAVLYAGGLLGSLILVRHAHPSQGAYLVFLVFGSIWLCDTFAYYGGVLFGRHKLFERVSPKKTWEGAVFGLVGGLVAVLVVRWIYQALGETIPLTVPETLVIGSIAGTIGQTGDLAESLLKRDAGVKDSSNLIPGHGGVLDRFDSLMFVSPCVYLYLQYFIR
jgi:phosphatidate cytidylyltransferase